MSETKAAEASLYPAFIRDNPIMQIAFRDFMTWFWDQNDAHAAFQAATGTPPLAKGLGSRIDEATGFMAHYAAKFTEWAVDTQWGVEGRDDTASAIEARSDATGTGAAEGESAAPKGDAQ